MHEIKTLRDGSQFVLTMYGYFPLEIYNEIQSQFDASKVGISSLRDYAEGDGLHVFTLLSSTARIREYISQLNRNGCPLFCTPSSCLGFEFKVLHVAFGNPFFIIFPEIITNGQRLLIYSDIDPSGKKVIREFKNESVPHIRKILDYFGVYL